MNITKQNGFVSSLSLFPEDDSDKYAQFRNEILDRARLMSNSSPDNQIDEYDESIMVFENQFCALDFLLNVFRTAVSLGKESDVKFKLKTSLCKGEYFLHHQQIYGDAVNLATRLTYSSRENELLVCGIERQVIEEFVDSQYDVVFFSRTQDKNCVALRLLDQDSTHRDVDNFVLKIGRGTKSWTFRPERNRRVTIGRAEDSDIIIDSDYVSRHHATIKICYGKISIEDHSVNGTYVYSNSREIFLIDDSLILEGGGRISCGRNKQALKDSTEFISYVLSSESSEAEKKPVVAS